MGTVPGPRRPGEVLRFVRAFATRPHLAMWELYREYGEAVAFRADSMTGRSDGVCGGADADELAEATRLSVDGI